MMSRVSSNKYTGHPVWGHLYLKLPNSVWGVETMDELVRMKRARLVQEVVQVRLHLVYVVFFPFPHFGGRIRSKRPFLHTFFLVVFQGMVH